MLNTLLRKFRTLLEFAQTGFHLGSNLRSRCSLAWMLPRFKWGLKRWNLNSRKFVVNIRLGRKPQLLHLRPPDIFILNEIHRGDPYWMPQLCADPPRRIVDLGAHIGLATLWLKRRLPAAEIHAYEPCAESFHLLSLNTRFHPGIFLHQAAVGEKAGVSMLHVYEDSPASNSLVTDKPEARKRKVACRVFTLDEILETAGGAVDLVKFDVEGIETPAFSRSRRIQQVPYIIGEMKASQTRVLEFLRLFPDHRHECKRVTRSTSMIYLWAGSRTEALERELTSVS
ncbi:MAG: FkbM family methyltransferase [Planctomycetota bacterium]